MAEQSQIQKPVFIELSEDDIELMRECVADKDEIIDEDEKERLKKLRKAVTTNDVNLAKLFLRCYDFFAINAYLFRSDDNKALKGKVRNYLDSFETTGLRSLLGQYEGGTGFGDYLTEENVRRIVIGNRHCYIDLVQSFFKIFIEED